jgi:glycosyltransferase involved in cell wall biosynthesis
MFEERYTPQRSLIAFATAWGSEFGGINVFNTELLQYLAFACEGQVSVACVVPTTTADSIELARQRGVKLVPLSSGPLASRLEGSQAEGAVAALRTANAFSDPHEVVWLGHDRITGEIALRSRDLVGGRAALIHHMSYSHYEAYAESASSAVTKSAVQRGLFLQADILYGIGPLLRDALRDMLPDRDVRSLVPGLDAPPVMPPPKTFTGFMSGRLTPDAARIKQGHLGVAGFADAHRRAYTESGMPEALKHQPRLILRGTNLTAPENTASAAPDTTDWSRFAEAYAGRVVNIQALPYTAERRHLLEELARSTVAMMPSWHEGFGLAGWEAVSAGVPLIVSIHSGLYQLLQEESHGAWASWVYPVDVLGKVDAPFFRDEDLRAVSDRLLEIARDPANARDKAARLREALLTRFDWKSCVGSMLAGLEWPNSLGADEQILPSVLPLVHVDVASVAHSISPLSRPRRMWNAGSGLAESQLLRAEEEAVPFDPARELELRKLLDWSDDLEYRQALRLISGNGGAGKTRLAIESFSHLIKKGWLCGFIPLETGAAHVEHIWHLIFAHEGPALIVLDYAETRQDVLIAFLRVMLHQTPKPHVRILLLARDAGEWWDRLPTRDSLCEAFLSGHATSGPFVLPPLHDTPSRRKTAFESALVAYADRLGLVETPRLEIDLTGDHFDRPLYIQMAALLALHGERPASAEGLTKALLNHERRYWRRVSTDLSAGSALPPTDDRYAAELMVLATLAGGFTRFKDSRDLLATWSDSAASELEPLHQRRLFERLSRLYPGNQGLQPLRPDLLGEALVAHELLQPSGMSLLDALLGSRSTTSQRRNALTVLARLSNHRLDLAETAVRGLARSFLSCAVDLINVATQTDSRLPEWGESAFARLTVPNRNQSAGLLMPHMRYESVQLSHLTSAISESVVEQARNKVHRKAGGLDSLAWYAEALRLHAISLGRAGRSASAVAKQAVEIYENLVAKHPNTFEPHLAAALKAFSNALQKDGEIADALDYSYRSLKLYERLAVKKPEEYESELAGVLDSHATYLAHQGRYKEALPMAYRAVQLYEKLAARDPDRNEGNWATVLHNYSGHLWQNNQHDEGMEFAMKALELRERLAATNSDRFEPKLTSTLLGYAAFISFRGEDAEALAYARRAESILEKLALKNAQLYEPEWAESITACANYFANSGEYAAALAKARQALEITRRLLSQNPLRFAEGFYIRSLAVHWFAWLAADPALDNGALPPEPDLSRQPSHRVHVLNLYRAWRDACYAQDFIERSSNLWIVVSEGSALEGPPFKFIEEFWLCAASWCSTHAMMMVSNQTLLTPLLTRYRAFLTQRQGTLPSWMGEVAVRMQFVWPE